MAAGRNDNKTYPGWKSGKSLQGEDRAFGIHFLPSSLAHFRYISELGQQRMLKGLLDEEQLLSAVTWHHLQSSAAAVNRSLQHSHDVGDSCQPRFTDGQTHMRVQNGAQGCSMCGKLS